MFLFIPDSTSCSCPNTSFLVGVPQDAVTVLELYAAVCIKSNHFKLGRDCTVGLALVIRIIRKGEDYQIWCPACDTLPPWHHLFCHQVSLLHCTRAVQITIVCMYWHCTLTMHYPVVVCSLQSDNKVLDNFKPKRSCMHSESLKLW